MNEYLREEERSLMSAKRRPSWAEDIITEDICHRQDLKLELDKEIEIEEEGEL